MYSNAKNLLTCYLTGDLLICKHHCGVPDKESSSQFTYRVWMLHTLFYFIAVGKVPGVPEPGLQPFICWRAAAMKDGRGLW